MGRKILYLLLGTFLVAFLVSLPTFATEEVKLTVGTDYDSFFFGADEFDKVGLTMLDKQLVGKLKETIKSGTDTNLNIRGDRREATLKNGQTVYYALKIREGSFEKLDSATFVLKTTPKSPFASTMFFQNLLNLVTRFALLI